MIAVELSALAIFMATIIAVAAFSGGQGLGGPAGGGSTEAGSEVAGGETMAADGEGEGVSQQADAGTAGLPDEAGDGEQRFDPEVDTYVPNEVLVMVDDPAVLDTLTPGTQLGDASIRSVEVISDDSGGGASVVKLTLDGDGSVDSSIDALNAMEGVSAQKNFIYHLM